MNGDDDLYELILGDYMVMRDTITEYTALIADEPPEDVSWMARRLVAAEDAMAEFLAGPMFLWLLSEAFEREDPRFDARQVIGAYASNRWLPVLMDTEDTPFKSLHPVRDPVALSIAGALLTAHTENGIEAGIVAIRRRVVEAVEARYGDGAAGDFNIDRVLGRMVDSARPRIDDWGFGEFWLAVEDHRLENLSTGAWSEEVYEMMVGELAGLVEHHADSPEEHSEEYYDFLDGPIFGWLWGQLAERDESRHELTASALRHPHAVRPRPDHDLR